jgi:class 3 adenylate cyclase
MAAESKNEVRRLATIMFTDMVGYSALVQKDEALALALLDEQRAILRAAFIEHGGREIDAVGDGFFVEFPSALSAARCAVAIQQRLIERNAAANGQAPIQVRIGLHIGDVVARENRVHGDAVNIAARIEPLAPPGGIYVSEDVARQIQNKIEVPVIKLGKGELKNIRLPVDIYRVGVPSEQQRPLRERVAFAFGRKRTRRSVAASGVAMLILLVLAGALTWQGLRSRQPREDPVLALPKGPSIAVLPFENLSGDPAQDFFAKGVAAEISAELSRSP